MTGRIWRAALSTLLAGLGCQAHRSAAAEHALPAGMRGLQLARPGADTSCLEPGGTRVSTDLSDADVSEVEVLIRRLDPRPIIEVTRLSPERVRETGGAELEARTGAECGSPLSGGGSEFYFGRVDGGWLMTGSKRLAGVDRTATGGAVSPAAAVRGDRAAPNDARRSTDWHLRRNSAGPGSLALFTNWPIAC